MRETVREGGQWGGLLGSWSSWMTAANMSAETRKLRCYHVGRLVEAFPEGPWSIDTETLTEWIAEQPWKPNTVRSHRTSFRAFWAWMIRTDRWEGRSPAHELPSVKIPRAKPRPTPEDDYRDALRVADPRARLAMLLGGSAGLRRGEIAKVRREDLEPDLLGWALRVVGKGGHVRAVPVTSEVATLIRSSPPGWLFPSPAGGHLTPGHIYVIVRRALGHSTHTLRHRAGTTAYAATKDLRAVQEFLGHAKPDTTAIYTEVPSASIRAAMEGAA